MRSMRSLIVLVAAMLPLAALGQITSQPSPACGKATQPIPIGSNVTFTWAAPTLNTDGSAITGALTYTLYEVSGVNPVLKATGITGTTATRSNLAAGTPCYALSATVGGVESVLSSTVALWVAAIPGPPKTVVCTITLPAAVTGPTPTGAVCTVQ